MKQKLKIIFHKVSTSVQLTVKVSLTFIFGSIIIFLKKEKGIKLCGKQ